jgi:hypothetical protein
LRTTDLLNLAYVMTRIVSLSILFAALIEFAIERARFDLWIATVVVVTLSWNLVGQVLRALFTRRSTTTMSPLPRTLASNPVSTNFSASSSRGNLAISNKSRA